jgi:hypothetical protein
MPMPSDYKCTMQNPQCAKRSDEILENENEQMLKFCQEAGLSLEQLNSQKKIDLILQICYKGNLVTFLLLYYTLRY